MTDKIAEIVPTANGCSIVLKSNSFSNNLMLTTGLDLTFLDPTGSTELTRVTLKPEEIGFESNGFSAPLPAEINNELAQKVNSYGGKFKVKSLEYDPVGSKAVGDPAYFDASVTGTLKVLQDYVKKEGESINAATFTEKKDPAFPDDKATLNVIKSSDETLNAAAEVASTATEATAVKTSNKGKILAVIAAVILLLFILGLLALFLAGFFGGAKDNSSNVNETAPQEQTENTAKDDASDNSDADDNTATEDNAATDDNTARANDANSESQDNTPAKETASAPSSSGSSTVCVITSDPDNVMIKNCISSKPDSATVSNFAKEAFLKDKCDLGKRLFSSYGRKDGIVAYTYGQYFDPNSQESTSCASKDKTQAVYWYEKAVELGNDNAKSALSALEN